MTARSSNDGRVPSWLELILNPISGMAYLLKRIRGDPMALQDLLKKDVTQFRAVEEFDLILQGNPQYRLLMEPVIRAFLQKSKLQLRADAYAEKTMLTKLETQLDKWKSNNVVDPELKALLFAHFYPGCSLINHVNAREADTVVKFDDTQGFLDITGAAPKVVAPGQRADAVQLLGVTQDRMLECELDADVMFSLQAWELDMISGLDASSFTRTRRMLRKGANAELSVAEVLTPYFGSVGVKADEDRKSRSPQVVLLRYQIDKIYEEIVLANLRKIAQDAKLDKSIYIPSNIPSKSVRGSIVLSDKMNPILRQWVLQKSSGHNKQLFGAGPLIVDGARTADDDNYFKDHKVLCVYWLAGVIKEVASVEDILKAGKHSKTVKPVLMAMAVYKKAGDGVEDMRLFFFSARDRQRISHTKEVVVRRLTNGVFVNRPPQQRSYDSDDSESESEDEFPEDDKFGDNSDDDSNSDDEHRRPRRHRHGYEKVPQVFRRDPTGAGVSSTSELLDSQYYEKPKLVEVHGLNRKTEEAPSSSAATGSSLPPPPIKHFHNVLQGFADIIARLIVKHDYDFNHVKASAIVRLQGNHFIYRERTYDAEFDILETRGSVERANELLAFEKEQGAADDDLTEPVIPFRLEPSTLPGSI